MYILKNMLQVGILFINVSCFSVLAGVATNKLPIRNPDHGSCFESQTYSSRQVLGLDVELTIFVWQVTGEQPTFR